MKSCGTYALIHCTNVHHLIAHQRVLRHGTGIFIYVTFGQPHFRKRYLTRPKWKVDTEELGDAFHYYCYTMRQVQSENE